MSSIPNPLGNQVSGNDDEFTAFLRSAVAEEVAKSHGQQQQQAPAQTGIPLTLNGQTVTFNSPEELSQAVAGLVQNLQAQQQQIVPQAPQVPQNEVAGNEPDFDINTFVTKMTTDPRDAFNYVDQARYGVANPAEAFKEALGAKKDLEEVKKVLTVYQFRDAHPEFPGGQQAGLVLQNIMNQNGLQLTPGGLEAAYALAIQNGQLPNYRAQAQGQQVNQMGQPQQNPYQQQNPYAQPYGAPQFQGQRPFVPGLPQGAADPRFYNGGANFAPPSVPRSSGDLPADIFAQAENLNTAQIEAIFSKFQQ
jgi:hypothetical protein